MSGAAALLDRAALRLLEGLRLRVRPASTGGDHGGHRGDKRSAGVQFAERREYVPGDDARSIDWNAFARDRSLTVRTFEEERDARVHVLVDVSASMALGAPPKIELARRVAAAFGFLGMNQVDRVRVAPFAESMGRPTETLRRRDQYPALEAFLRGLNAHGTTGFADAVRGFLAQTPARGYVVVVSDLMEGADWGAPLRALAERGHQLCVVRVRCDADHAPDLRGELELTDAETGELLRVTATPALVEAYRAEVSAHAERVRDACRRAGGTFVDAPVELAFDEALRRVIAPALEAR
ncbi:MAG: DUF58 domain-containing protein [Polyangiales bacterium]